MGTYKYSAEFRAGTVVLARSSGRPVSRIAAELGVNHETLRQWIKAAEKTERPDAVAESAKDAEIAALSQAGPRAGDGTRHPAPGGQVFCGRDELVSRFEFVADHSDAFGVKRLCTVLNLSRPGFYRWLKTAPARAAKKAADAALTRRIRKVHAESGRTYGAKRITAELRANGVMVNRKRVPRRRECRGPELAPGAGCDPSGDAGRGPHGRRGRLVQTLLSGAHVVPGLQRPRSAGGQASGRSRHRRAVRELVGTRADHDRCSRRGPGGPSDGAAILP